MEMSWAFDGDLMVKSCKNRALYGNIIQKLGFNGNIILKCEKTHNWGYVCWDNQQEYEDLTSNAEHGGFLWRCNEVRGLFHGIFHGF